MREAEILNTHERPGKFRWERRVGQSVSPQDTCDTHHAARYTATYDNAGLLDKIKMMYPVAAAWRQVGPPIPLQLVLTYAEENTR